MSTAKASIVIGGNTSELDAAVAKAGASLQSLAGMAVGLFAGAATFTWGYDLLKQSDSAEIAFTKLLGSSDAAKQTLKEIADFAAKTPMDNPSLVKAYQQLLAFKFAAEDIPGVLRVLGDTASAMPGNMAENVSKLSVIMGQMRSKAKLSAGEMLQLTESGVNAWEYLRQALNLSSVAEVVAMSERGAIDSATAVRAVLAGMEKDYTGIMEKRSKTVEGLVSTIQDNLGRGLQAVFKGATGQEFTTWLENFGNGLNNLGASGEAIGKRIAEAFSVVKGVFDSIWNVASTIGELIYSGISTGFEALTSGIGAFVNEFRDVFNIVYSWIEPLISGIGGGLNTVFTNASGVAFKFIEGVAVGFALIGDAVNNYVVGPIKVVAGALTQFFSVLIDGVGYLLDGLGYISDAAANAAKATHEAARAVNEWGGKLAKSGVNDVMSGNVMGTRVRNYFQELEAKKQTKVAGVNTSELLKKPLLNFEKPVKDMTLAVQGATVAATQFQLEMSKAAAEAAKKHTDAAKTPADILRADMKELQGLFNDRMINRNTFGDALRKRFKDAAANGPQYVANTAIAAGSVEAQSIIQANRQGGSTKAEDILKSIDREAQLTRKLNEEFLKQLTKAKIVTVGIN